jgi:hypothetical protein
LLAPLARYSHSLALLTATPFETPAPDRFGFDTASVRGTRYLATNNRLADLKHQVLLSFPNAHLSFERCPRSIPESGHPVSGLLDGIYLRGERIEDEKDLHDICLKIKRLVLTWENFLVFRDRDAQNVIWLAQAP